MISWSHLQLTNRLWDQNSLFMLFWSFDLMIDLLVTRTLIRSKLVKLLCWVLISWSKIQPPDQYYCKFWFHKKENFNLMIKNLISWKSCILISWDLTSWPPLTFLSLRKNILWIIKLRKDMAKNVYYLLRCIFVISAISGFIWMCCLFVKEVVNLKLKII